MKLLDAIKLAYTAYKSKALVCVPNQHYTATVRAVPSHSQYDKMGLHGIYEIDIMLGDVEIGTVRRKGIDFKQVHKELIRKSVGISPKKYGYLSYNSFSLAYSSNLDFT